MQGQPARQECPLKILQILLEKSELSFEELVSSLPYSRGTVNKYLSELYTENLVERRGRRGKYFLSDRGKEETVRRFGESSEKAFNDYIKSVIQLTQEGHAKILTKDEISQINSFKESGVPIQVDNVGLKKLGIGEGQAFALNIVRQAAMNLNKRGINTGILINGEKSRLAVGIPKNPEMSKKNNEL
jgi:predicted transcriptional regulator